MHHTVLSPHSGARMHVVVFDAGEEPVAGLLQVAREQELEGSQVVGIGALRRVVLGYWEPEREEYRRITIEEQVEVLSLAGNIAEGPDGKPFLHAHIVVGKRDGSAHGGHLLEAEVHPTLEVVLTESNEVLHRRHDPKTGLALLSIPLQAGS